MAPNPLRAARLGPKGTPLTKIGIKDEFPWVDFDTDGWPGREILWVWCHPILSLWLFLGGVAFVWLLVTN